MVWSMVAVAVAVAVVGAIAKAVMLRGSVVDSLTHRWQSLPLVDCASKPLYWSPTAWFPHQPLARSRQPPHLPFSLFPSPPASVFRPPLAQSHRSSPLHRGALHTSPRTPPPGAADLVRRLQVEAVSSSSLTPSPTLPTTPSPCGSSGTHEHGCPPPPLGVREGVALVVSWWREKGAKGVRKGCGDSPKRSLSFRCTSL